MNTAELLQIAKNCLNTELEGAYALQNIIDQNLIEICQIISKCKGKIAISGVGKSGHIGKKISSTMSSIGIPSFFIHPTEASHGDLGVLTQDDIVILISNSGESLEFNHLLEFVKNNNILSIGISRNANSTLANAVNYKITIPQFQEVISYNAPTTSTTQTLILGDIISVCVSHLKGFTKQDYAKIHPGGKLGLSLKSVSLIMNTNFFICDGDAKLIDVLPSMHSGIIIVKHKNGFFTFTDGDLRRAIIKFQDISSIKMKNFTNKNPIIINQEDPIIKAIEIFNQHSIGSIIVINKKGEPCGLVERKEVEF